MGQTILPNKEVNRKGKEEKKETTKKENDAAISRAISNWLKCFPFASESRQIVSPKMRIKLI